MPETKPTGVHPVEVVQVGEPFDAFRIVKANGTFDPLLADSLKSHYETGRPPHGPENRRAVIHMGISMYLTEEAAKSTALAWPKIGGWIARVRLIADRGFSFALTGPPNHITVWGRPPQLLGEIVDIVQVEE